jgi:hypothetical protein
MSKKIFLVFTAMLMLFAFGQSAAFADEATTVKVEGLTGLTATPISTYPSAQPLRARVLILDSKGELATTFAGGPVNTAKLVIKSLNFGSEVRIATVLYEVNPVPSYPLNGSNAQISLSGPVQEIAITYDDVTELGQDELRFSLQRTVSDIIKNESPILINVIGPPANTYVVRTGGIPDAQLPEVLDEIPTVKNNNFAKLRAGQLYEVDVFAAYALDADKDGVAEKCIVTNNIPANALSTPYGALDPVTGHVKKTDNTQTSIDVTGGVDPDASISDQLASMASVFAEGITSTVALGFPTSRYIGNKAGDVTASGRIDLTISAQAAPPLADPNLAYSDKINFKPAKISKINLLSLPVTDIDDDLVTLGADLSVVDMTAFVPDFKVKKTNNYMNTTGDPASGQVYAALVGYDVYGNLAPFYQDQSNYPYEGALVGFQLLATADAAAANTAAYVGYGTAGGTGEIITTNPLQAFIALRISPEQLNLHVIKSPTYASPIDTTVLKDIDELAEARNFAVFAAVTGVTIPPINVEAGGNDSVRIQVAGTTLESAFDMSAFYENGGLIGVNQEGQSTAAEKVSIPTKENFQAEQDVSFYSAVSAEPLRLVFTGLSKGVSFLVETDDATIEPADPGDYPPSAVSGGFSAKAYLDNEERHDEGEADGSISIFDAFGNAYAGIYNGSSVTAEDADPIVQVLKSDGTTPFPGASGEVNDDSVLVSFDIKSITPEDSTAIVRISAGEHSTDINLTLAPLQRVNLKNIYAPVLGADVPVMLNFAKLPDPTGMLVPPVILSSGLAGSFELEIAVVDGFYSGGGVGEKTLLTTSTPYRIFRAQPAPGKTAMTITADGKDAKAGEATLSLDFKSDLIKPEIGTITAGSCNISIVITDKTTGGGPGTVDLVGTTVAITDGVTGQPVTPKNTSYTGDGTAEGTITLALEIPAADLPKEFSLNIDARDKAGNSTGPQTRTVTVASCPAPECTTVDPSFGKAGDTLDVTITGVNTTFSDTSTVAFGCAGITVNTVSATSLTTLVANITIAADAATCPAGSVTIDGVTCEGKFAIGNIPPSCATLTPSTIKAGNTTDVVIALSNIDLTGVTSVTVGFGCTGVTVNSATVNSTTEITANITVAATAPGGTCDVTITGASSVGIVCANAFTVEPLPPCTITVDPDTVKTGFLFPRTYTLTVTASDSCVFDDTTTVSFSGNVTIVGTPVISGNTATVEIRTKPVILGGKGTNTLTVTTGTQTATATLTVTGLFF